MDFLIDGKPLTNRKAHKILVDLFHHLFDGVTSVRGFEVRLLYGKEREDEKLLPMNGKVVTANGPSDRLPIKFAYVAMPDCFPDEDAVDYPGADDPVDAYDFVGTMVAILHERRHVDQILMDRSPESALCKIFAVNGFAKQENPEYYDKNYAIMPTEIDAQYMALRQGHELLKSVDGIGEKAAGEYICHYQNERRKTVRCDFIPKPFGGYKSADDIFDAFADSFKRSVHARRSYNVLDIAFRSDWAARALRLDLQMGAQFEAEHDGFAEEQMLASLYFEHMARRYGKSGVGLRNNALDQLRNDMDLDLSIPGTFGASFADRVFKARPQPGDSLYLANRALNEIMEQVEAWNASDIKSKLADDLRRGIGE